MTSLYKQVISLKSTKVKLMEFDRSITIIVIQARNPQPTTFRFKLVITDVYTFFLIQYYNNDNMTKMEDLAFRLLPVLADKYNNGSYQRCQFIVDRGPRFGKSRYQQYIPETFNGNLQQVHRQSVIHTHVEAIVIHATYYNQR